MSTLKQLRIEARASYNEVGRVAGVAGLTVSRAERGEAIQELKAIQIAQGLSQLLGRTIRLEDIEGLNVYKPA